MMMYGCGKAKVAPCGYSNFFVPLSSHKKEKNHDQSCYLCFG